MQALWQLSIAQGDTTVSGTTESNLITFKPLNPNDFVTVNGLTFTARVNMTANEVAAAFSNIASGATSAALTLANPVAANFGKFSGTFTAGFSTGASTTDGKVTATSTTANTNVTRLSCQWRFGWNYLYNSRLDCGCFNGLR
jgi:hypothetical protein